MQDSYDVNLKCEFEFKGPGLRAQGPRSADQQQTSVVVLSPGPSNLVFSADSTQWQRAQGPGLRAAMAQGSGLNM